MSDLSEEVEYVLTHKPSLDALIKAARRAVDFNLNRVAQLESALLSLEKALEPFADA